MARKSNIQAEQLVEVSASPSEEYLSEEPDSPDDGSSEETTTTQVSAEATPDTPAPATTQQPPVVDIDQAVARINELAIGTIYEGHTQIGEYVLQTFFNNDQQLAQSKNPFKTAPSYRILCQREDLLVSPANLNRSVRVAIQERFFREQGLQQEQGFQNLTFTHKAALVRMPNNPDKVEFVRNLLNNLGTTRALADQVKNYVSGLSSPREPNAAKIILNQLISLNKWIEKHDFYGNQVHGQNIQIMRETAKKRLREKVQIVEAQLMAINRVISTIKTALTNQPTTQQQSTGQVAEQNTSQGAGQTTGGTSEQATA